MGSCQTACHNSDESSFKKGQVANGSLSFLSTLLLILIPKCPLCLTAYMSAVVLFFDLDHAQVAPILLHTKPIMGALILLLILLNRKDGRTWIALGIASIAFILLIIATYYSAIPFPNWFLYVAFIFAIWYNGNFRYFFRFIRFSSQKRSAL